MVCNDGWSVSGCGAPVGFESAHVAFAVALGNFLIIMGDTHPAVASGPVSVMPC